MEPALKDVGELQHRHVSHHQFPMPVTKEFTRTRAVTMYRVYAVMIMVLVVNMLVLR